MGKPTSDELKKMEVSALSPDLGSTRVLPCFVDSQEIPSNASGDGLFECKDLVDLTSSSIAVLSPKLFLKDEIKETVSHRGAHSICSLSMY